jgi:hypothetical protein
MLSFRHGGVRLCDGVNRREWLRVGGLSELGLSLTDLLTSQSARSAESPATRLTAGLSGAMFGKAKSVIFLWLQGGPPQHETFDPKPEAPQEIRGPFKPIQTNVPGIQFCELLPRTAQRADKLAVIHPRRSSSGGLEKPWRVVCNCFDLQIRRRIHWKHPC